MSRIAISANPEHYIFKTFRGEHARIPLEGLQFFLAAVWLKKSPNNKILDRTSITKTKPQTDRSQLPALWKKPHT